jgi:hypothetical protein
MRRSRVPLVLAAALLAGAAVPDYGGERLPYHLAVRVGFGTEGGSASLSDDAARALVADLSAKGCFRDVLLAPTEGAPETELLLEVTLSDVLEEVRYEQSLAERVRPRDAVEAAMGRAARLSFRTDLRLAALPSGALVRQSGFRVGAERRPRTPGEDAREGARADATLDLARKVRSDLCRASGSRLKREIEAVRRVP